MSKASVAVISLDDGLSALTEFAHRQDKSIGGIDWSILTHSESGYEVHTRTSQPCYGEMRPYAQGSASNGPYEPELFPLSQRIVHKPGDLYSPFPKGTPMAVALPLLGRSEGVDKEAYDWAMENIILNPDVSPWHSILKDYSIERNAKGHVTGLVIKDTEIDPTVMVNLFRKISQNLDTGMIEVVRDTFPTKSQLAVFVVSQAINYNWGDHTKISWKIGTEYDHFWGGPSVNWEAIMNGKPEDLTDGGTLKQRYAYNRPKNDYIWGKGQALSKVKGAPTTPWFKVSEIEPVIDWLTSLIKE